MKITELKPGMKNRLLPDGCAIIKNVTRTDTKGFYGAWWLRVHRDCYLENGDFSHSDYIDYHPSEDYDIDSSVSEDV